jgi:hypothetical protein
MISDVGIKSVSSLVLLPLQMPYYRLHCKMNYAFGKKCCFSNMMLRKLHGLDDNWSTKLLKISEAYEPSVPHIVSINHLLFSVI